MQYTAFKELIEVMINRRKMLGITQEMLEIVSSIVKFHKNSQLIITTNSPIFISYFKPKYIRICEDLAWSFKHYRKAKCDSAYSDRSLGQRQIENIL